MLTQLFKLLLIPQDKASHIVYGAVTFAVFIHISIASAIFFVVASAIGKEVYDRAHPTTHTSDVWDAVATMAGGLLGFVCWIRF